jgi:hypothetical protein
MIELFSFSETVSLSLRHRRFLYYSQTYQSTWGSAWEMHPVGYSLS